MQVRLVAPALTGLALTLSACAAGTAQQTAQQGAAPSPEGKAPATTVAPKSTTVAPTGATLEASGFATITDAPADLAGLKLYVPNEQGMDDFARVGAEQNRLFPIMNPVANQLRRREKANFIDHYIDNDGPQVMFVFLFRKDGPATLAKYTRHPQAIAKNVNWAKDEREAQRHIWMKRLADAGIYVGSSIDIKTGMIEMETGMTQSDFDAVKMREGWTLPSYLTIKTLPEYERPAIDPSAAPFVRFFPQSKQAATVQLSNAIFGKVSMRDGCIFVSSSDGPPSLALFDKSYGITLDEEGYLALRSRGPIRDGEYPYKARIGERVVFSGSDALIKDEALQNEAEQKCGTRSIVNIATPDSMARFNFRDYLIRALMDKKGWSEAQAVDEYRRCVRIVELGTTVPPPRRPSDAERLCGEQFETLR